MEYRILGKTGLKVSRMGFGGIPIQRIDAEGTKALMHAMLDMGINVALGTDGAASNNNLNMFEEMHLAAIIHNGYRNDAVIMKPETVLRMATVNGAKLQGRDNTGCLEVGKKADIIAIDFRDKPHMYPAFEPMAMLVYAAQASDVCMTMVDGKILYENGQFLTLDRAQVIENAKAAVQRLYKGDVQHLAAAMEKGDVVFHEGRICGAWPQIIER